VAYFSDAPISSAIRPVVVTGAGILSPMGHGWQENSLGFRAGRSAFTPVTLFDVSRQRVGTAGQVALSEAHPAGEISRKAWSRMDRGSRLAWWAAREAMTDAGLAGGDIPFVIGTSAMAMPIGEDYFRQALATTLDRATQLRRVETYQVHRQMTDLARELGMTGPQRIISNACASGANAIGHAFHLVRSGRAERVLAGGYDALCQLVFCGFDALQALAPSGVPRPFDAARDGLALGEGAAFVVVESAESAKARGARVIAEILGHGAATDVHHLTQPNPQGDTALATMQAACAMAGISPAQIDYLNSHGTGTPLNDVAEGNAIQRWAGDDIGEIHVSSTKSAIGHLLGGAGAVESVICLIALEGQFLPASLHVRETDPVCTFDLVREPRAAVVKRVLTNSFGFGGSNASLIFGKEGLA
jgi:3-oxoacyl-[acyl-carrier-protein] synthase II